MINSRTFWWVYGWVVIRPIRKFFFKLARSHRCRWWFEKDRYRGKYYWPNFHWHFLYKTVFKFFKWLRYDVWRKLAVWKDGRRKSLPFSAWLVKRIGETTAGYAISGGECYHCGNKEGCQVEIVMWDQQKNGESEYFELEDTWTVSTPDGTDHRFKGTTTCPVCGYQDSYEDGSL